MKKMSGSPKNLKSSDTELDRELLTGVKKNILISIFLGVIGWANAFYALWHRQGLFINGLTEKSFCNVNQAIDCDSVAFSKFSAFLGLPTATWGMIFYALCTVLLLSAYFAAQDQKSNPLFSKLRLIFFFNVLNIIPTFALAGISLFKLGTLCLICLITYLINVAMLYFSYKAHALVVNHPGAGQIDSPLKNAFSNVVIGAGALLLALHILAPRVVNQMIGTRGLDESVINDVLSDFASQMPVSFDIANGPSFGPDNAPLVIVEFSDFQCPHCALSSKTMPSFLKAYSGQVKYVYKFYPLDSSCNPQIKSAFHSLACRAAKTAYCVYKEKGTESFFRYKSNVFDGQESMSPESILTMAKDEGIDESTLNTCFQDPSTHQFILDNVSEGTLGKIEGTPAIFVNGRLVKTGPTPKVLSRVFDLILNSLAR